MTAWPGREPSITNYVRPQPPPEPEPESKPNRSIRLSREIDGWLDSNARANKCRGKAQRFEQLLALYPPNIDLDYGLLQELAIKLRQSMYAKSVQLSDASNERLDQICQAIPAHLRPHRNLIAAAIITYFQRHDTNE